LLPDLSRSSEMCPKSLVLLLSRRAMRRGSWVPKAAGQGNTGITCSRDVGPQFGGSRAGGDVDERWKTPRRTGACGLTTNGRDPVAVQAPTGTMSRSQTQRRKRIVQTAAALAVRGGVEAMQMRSVAERAGVALGTLYRYFPSKMDLVVAV